jgi:hypothetical protein
VSSFTMRVDQDDMRSLTYSDYLPNVPKAATWWRQCLYPGPDGNQYVMQFNDDWLDRRRAGAPVCVTITWFDGGLNEHIRPYAARVLNDDDDRERYYRGVDPAIRLLWPGPPTRRWLDVLYVGPPTGKAVLMGGSQGGKWEPLTSCGHIHPDNRQDIARLRAEWQLEVIGKLLGA